MADKLCGTCSRCQAIGTSDFRCRCAAREAIGHFVKLSWKPEDLDFMGWPLPCPFHSLENCRASESSLPPAGELGLLRKLGIEMAMRREEAIMAAFLEAK